MDIKSLHNKRVTVKCFGTAFDVIFHVEAYQGTPCIGMLDASDGIPLCILTENIPGVDLLPDELLVKTNEEIEQDLLAQGLFVDTGRRVKTEFVEAAVWKVV